VPFCAREPILRGSFFNRNSPRNVGGTGGGACRAVAAVALRVVALVADATDREIAEAVCAADPDFIQLHGAEPPERVAFIRVRFGKPVIKALELRTKPILRRSRLRRRRRHVALRCEAAGARKCSRRSWAFLRLADDPYTNITQAVAARGWLDAENVSRAIRSSGAPGVDVSSGVETAPGVEIGERDLRFHRAARATGLAGACNHERRQFLAQRFQIRRAISAPMAAASSPRR